MIYSICMTQDGNPVVIDGSKYIHIHEDNNDLIKAMYGRYMSHWHGLKGRDFLPRIDVAKCYLESTILIDATRLTPYCGKPWSDPRIVLDAFRWLKRGCELYPDAIVEVDT